MMETPRVLSEKQAAKYIGMSAGYLRNDRMNGPIGDRTPGPVFVKVGWRVMYLVEDLDAWLKAHRVEREAG